MDELILASKSPRRRELMKLLGHPFICIVSSVEENTVNGETPVQHVTRLSDLKARDVGTQRNNGIVIGSDTIVVLDDTILMKPCSPEDAVEMLMRIQGHTHTVYTGFVLFNAATKAMVSCYETTRVTICTVSRDLAQRYVET